MSRVVRVTLCGPDGSVTLDFRVGPNSAPNVPHLLPAVLSADPPPEIRIVVVTEGEP